MVDTEAPKTDDNKTTFLGVAAAGFLIWAIAVTVMLGNERSKEAAPSMAVEESASMLGVGASLEATNVCHKKKIDLPNIECFLSIDDDDADVSGEVVVAGPQAGANVTQGHNGDLEVDVEPITTPYYQAGLCPVNVHWHLGTEHYSAGEYDCDASIHDEHRELGEEKVCGPTPVHERRKLAGKARQGFQCNYYDAEDPKFTTPYEWKFCDKTMEVGQTYEVHWPHSAAGACGTPNQYQTPFYDGVMCNLDLETLLTLAPQDIANAVGVQAQIFTIVNDEAYYYPDLFRGMVVEPELGMGSDMAIYTGSTTGTSRDNTICSSYTPITWQVDRKCHLISASSFDKMCADMMEQRDDMSDDLYAHGSRVLVDDALVANNYATRGRRARA
mmetsp:Transcript_14916/g.34523  ORF Transcript_14916/g.34523 Transcript_14916/m.34523 type:complete len:386 (+) Transcript_14916:118-1275(+)|eukprot:CAMPEP_0172393468 /NCGR_PEP_ID=MMETSP1061-20121228/10087_1 /TAXON_ID=37318 /ORGANISM="Pseudo-nitzschia pungens, Strain cf. pungens" /LENGTH=385 /DNA_ID=CAMNT_0013124551 /DNA_START=100 /DNA_END=1257 /DNA_ORIENTATION=-